MNNVLEINCLNSIISSKKGPVYVLNDISFSIPRGKTIGIIGESGSGKTQLMMAITGTQSLTPGVVSGSVKYFGDTGETPLSFYPDQTDLNKKYAVYRTVDGNYKRKNADSFERFVRDKFKELRGTKFGIIPQDVKSFLNPYWTVDKFFLEAYKRLDKTKLLEDSNFETFFKINVDKFDLNATKIKNKYPGELSGGEAQRVMNAFVLAHKPQVIFADESTTGLDMGRQKEVIHQLEVLKEENPRTSIIIISHDFAFLSHLVDAYIVMFGGFLLEAIYDKSRLQKREVLHPYTADLLSSLDPIIFDTDKSAGITGLLSDYRKKLIGCPYTSRCKLLDNGNNELRNKCTNELPPLVNYRENQSDQSSNTDWQRCWYRYLNGE